jgi:hypothetical protein
VTVLFADVVHSMDIAATVGAERLRDRRSEAAAALCADRMSIRLRLCGDQSRSDEWNR